MRRSIDPGEQPRGPAATPVFRTLFLALATIGALAAVLGVIVAVGVLRLLTSAPRSSSTAAMPSTAPASAPSADPVHPVLPASQPVPNAPGSVVNDPPAGAPQTAPATVAADQHKIASAVPDPAPGPSPIALNAADARLRGSMIRRDDATHDIIGWVQSDDHLDWQVEAPRGEVHTYAVNLTYARGAGGGADFFMRFFDSVQTCHIEQTGSWTDFKTVRIGTILVTGGKHQLTFRPVPPLHSELMRVRRVDLVPAAN